jgi:hypothetical protein
MSRKDLNAEILDDFQPRQQHAPQKIKQSVEKAHTGWARREAPIESQFTIRARVDTIERFKQLCRPTGGGRFTYGEMLERLMNQAEGKD